MFPNAHLFVHTAAGLALAVTLTGCALSNPTTRTTPTAYREVPSPLKDEAWGTYTVTPAKPQANKSGRQANAAPPRPGARAPSASERDSCGTPDQCALQLKLMIEDSERRWIGQWPSTASYADGTRLFAYRLLRAELTCPELVLALDEIRSVAKSFGGAVPGVKPEQVTRVRALNIEVESQLQTEHAERCDPSSPPRPAS